MIKMNEKEKIRKAFLGFPARALRFHPVENDPHPSLPAQGPGPQVQYLHTKPLVRVLEAVPRRAQHLRVGAEDEMGPHGLVLPLIGIPALQAWTTHLDEHGGLHEVMSTNALVKARPFITERNLGVEAEMKGSIGQRDDTGTVQITAGF